VAGKQYDITISASDVSDFSGMEITLQYDTAVFSVDDLCAYTRIKETTSGAIAAAGITITQVSAGEIRFTVDKAVPAGMQWSGPLTTICLQAKATTVSNVTVSK
jgi:hypothetical protein